MNAPIKQYFYLYFAFFFGLKQFKMSQLSSDYSFYEDNLKFYFIRDKDETLSSDMDDARKVSKAQQQ